MGESACPTENTLGAFVDGRLDEAAFADVERHVDTCAPCRELISAMATVRTADSGPRSARGPGGADADVPSETVIGRFVVMGVLGRGGMGVVYRAHDPALDRDVALKLLRTDGDEAAGDLDGGDAKTPGAGPEAASARLEREAQAIARVRHPNVIAVHDVGIFEGRVFLTMELVEGESLASFIAREERPPAQVIAAFEKAGLGLHAAHEAGLVHRDFKPENVLVGRDGRILVTDFGLACAVDRAEPAAAERARPLLTSGTLTRTGALLGTPAYMAPEQHLGAKVSARSDQFSFCVALWEALTGERPFPTLDDRLAGRVAEPRRAPGARARRVLLRGLRAAPAERYPSMLALLADLAPPRSRLAAPAAAALAAAVLVAGVAFAVLAARGRNDVCAAARAGLPGVWDPARRQAVDAALLASGKPYAADAAREVERVVDAYAARWSAMRADACEATHVRREQSEDLLDRRMRCLDGRRAALDALVAQLEKGGDIVSRAAGAAHGLEGLGPCADAAALLARVAPPRELGARAEAEAIDRDLGAVRADLDLGRAAAARPRLDAILARARALGHGPTLARALWLAGLVQSASADPLAAESSLREAAHVADAAGDDETRARAWMELTRLLGFRTERVGEGLAAADEARVALTRLGGSEELEAKRLDGLAIVLHSAGRDAEALDHFRHALAIRERVLGPDAREVGESLSHLGSVLVGTGGDADREALARLLRAQTITERVYGPAHPAAASGRYGIARALLMMSHFEESLAESRRTLPLIEAAQGPDHPTMAYAIGNYGLALDGLGRHEEALVEIRRALALFERTLGPKHREVGENLVDVGATLTKLHRYDEAETSIQRGLAQLEEILPPTHPFLSSPLGALGTLRLEQGRPADALPPLRRALSLAEKEGPATRAEIRFALARALSATGRQAEAEAAAATTDAEVLAAGDAATPTKIALAAWREQARSGPPMPPHR